VSFRTLAPCDGVCMIRNVSTPDGVEWTVSVGRPRLGGGSGDLSVGADESGGFGPLILVASVVLLGVVSPALIGSGRWWVLLLVPVLAGGIWILLGRYPVEIRRDGAAEPLHRTWVAGRRQAQRIATELAEEISRTPDEKLSG